MIERPAPPLYPDRRKKNAQVPVNFGKLCLLIQILNSEKSRGVAPKPIGGCVGALPQAPCEEKKSGLCPEPHSGDCPKSPLKTRNTFKKGNASWRAHSLFFIKFFGVPRTFFSKKVLGGVWGGAPMASLAAPQYPFSDHSSLETAVTYHSPVSVGVPSSSVILSLMYTR